jgi:ribosome assembly protein YihI (activator of Der GTPase)
MMKEFTNVRELIGQIGLDLDSKAGKISSTFRENIRKELESLGDEKTVSVSIEQVQGGTSISLKIEDWVDRPQRTTIIEEFKDLMDRLGATKTGMCTGTIPSNLVAFLNKGE